MVCVHACLVLHEPLAECFPAMASARRDVWCHLKSSKTKLVSWMGVGKQWGSLTQFWQWVGGFGRHLR